MGDISKVVNLDCNGFITIESLNNTTNLDVHIDDTSTTLEYENESGIEQNCIIPTIINLDNESINLTTCINVEEQQVDLNCKIEADVLIENGQGPAGRPAGILVPVNEKINIINTQQEIECLHNVHFIIHDEIYIHARKDINKPFQRIAGFDELTIIDNKVQFELVDLSQYTEIYVKICYFTEQW